MPAGEGPGAETSANYWQLTRAVGENTESICQKNVFRIRFSCGYAVIHVLSYHIISQGLQVKLLVYLTSFEMQMQS